MTLDTSGTTTVQTWGNSAGVFPALSNSAKSQQPLLLQSAVNGLPALRFDGVDDTLLSTQSGLGTAIPEATVFLVVAPRSNGGGYRAFFSGRATGGNDYLTGLNIDMMSAPSSTFSTLNFESPKRRTPGGIDFMTADFPFATWHIVQVNCWNSGFRMVVDGIEQDILAAAGNATLDFTEIRVGSRFYAGVASGFLDGDIAEVLIYDRQLSCHHISQTGVYLSHKYNLPGGYQSCAADYNDDCLVDFFDYLDFVAAFATQDPAADFNQDSVVDLFDYLDFVGAFAGGC